MHSKWTLSSKWRNLDSWVEDNLVVLQASSKWKLPWKDHTRPLLKSKANRRHVHVTIKRCDVIIREDRCSSQRIMLRPSEVLYDSLTCNRESRLMRYPVYLPYWAYSLFGPKAMDVSLCLLGFSLPLGRSCCSRRGCLYGKALAPLARKPTPLW